MMVPATASFSAPSLAALAVLGLEMVLRPSRGIPSAVGKDRFHLPPHMTRRTQMKRSDGHLFFITPWVLHGTWARGANARRCCC